MWIKEIDLINEWNNYIIPKLNVYLQYCVYLPNNNELET